MTEDVHWQLFVAVVGEEVRWPQDDCNNLQGLAGGADAGAGAGAGAGVGMCSVGVSVCRVQVVVAPVGL